ncbi:MAG: Holliday junction branch migration protein RuvA, partial [Clostridia bacterium]|nr:Holliday junction branch migration protein RuvA [Clostridia bacterium]
MYAYIKGIVADKGQNEVVIDAGGVGYLLSCSMTTLQEVPPVGESMKMHTYLSVREDAMELFGFATREEKNMFTRLLSVSGIGPKVALSILGSMPLRDLTLAIVTGDTTTLSRAPGVGKKTAQRLALELKEKVDQSDLENVPASAGAYTPVQEDAATEALAALQALGYTPAEAAKAISQVRGQSDSANELVRLALRSMASPFLSELANKLEVGACLVTRHDYGTIYLDFVDNPVNAM